MRKDIFFSTAAIGALPFFIAGAVAWEDFKSEHITPKLNQPRSAEYDNRSLLPTPVSRVVYPDSQNSIPVRITFHEPQTKR